MMVTHRSSEASQSHPRRRLTLPGRAVGLVLLAAAAGACGVLVLQHFGAAGWPGCGLASDCAAAAASRWGQIAGRPTAFFGLAYFLALAAAWALARRDGVSSGFRWVVRGGALVSAFYLSVMAIEGLYCVYCLAAHAANLAFWVLAECAPRAAVTDGRPLLTFGSVMAVILTSLNFADVERQWRLDQHAEQQLQAAIQQIRAGAQDQASEPAPPIRAEPFRTTVDPAELAESSTGPHDVEAAPAHTTTRHVGNSFEGRFPRGPGDAPVRLVVFYDYQCEHCRELDRELKALAQQFAGVLSVSVRHYPLSTDCNYLLTENTHPNACRAALAAEAAGVLHGAEGFWRFHDWLVRRKGEFSDDELRAGLAELGFASADSFVETMQAESIRRRVLGDIIEAEARKVERTPAVFINGVPLHTWHTGNALARAIGAAAEPLEPSAEPASRAAIGADFPQRVRERGLDATVRVVNPASQTTGSGAVVGNDGVFFYVLTVRHLMRDGEPLEVHAFDRHGGAGPFVHGRATVVAAGSGADDVALLRARATGAVPPAMPICPVASIPQSSAFTAASVGCTEGGPPVAMTHRLVREQRVRRSETDPVARVWATSEPAQPGRSGGPLIDERGLVVGIQSGSDGNRGYYCHTTAIHELLRQADMQWLAVADAQPATAR